MSQRSNEEIIRIVEKYQNFGMVHELTCGVDSRHQALEPVERDGTVILVCPTCLWVQETIPAFVLGSEEMIDYSVRKWAEAHALAARRHARQDVWFAVMVILFCCSILPGLVGGLVVGLTGAATGAIIAALYARHAFRKIDADPESRP